MIDISYKDLKLELEFNKNSSELFYNNIKLQHISQSSKGLNKDVYKIDSLFDDYNIIDMPEGYQLKKYISITKLVDGINVIKGLDLLSKTKKYNYYNNSNKDNKDNKLKKDSSFYKTYIMSEEDTAIVEAELNKIKEYNEQIKILNNKIIDSNDIIKGLKSKYEQLAQYKKVETYVNSLSKDNIEHLIKLLQAKQDEQNQ